MENNKIPQTRKELLLEALERCFDEIYQHSQPPVSWKQLNENVENNVYGENVRDAYKFHYISMNEYNDIREKYLYMYNVKSDWKHFADLMINYLKNGGIKDKYFKEKIDENGFKHPGYRGYEDVPKLDKQLEKIIHNDSERHQVLEKVFELMNECKNFYRHDSEETSFIFSLMNLAPSFNKEDVIDEWKKLGKDIEIIDKIQDPYSEEWVYPDEVEGYKPGLVFNYDIDEWVTLEELKQWKRNNPTPVYDIDEDEDEID